GQGRRQQGRGRQDQGSAREGWREGRAQVTAGYLREIPGERSETRDPEIKRGGRLACFRCRPAKGMPECRSNTKTCGDSVVYPSNLQDCRPRSGWQHESTTGGGEAGIPSQVVGRQAISGFCSPQ